MFAEAAAVVAAAAAVIVVVAVAGAIVISRFARPGEFWRLPEQQQWY